MTIDDKAMNKYRRIVNTQTVETRKDIRKNNKSVYIHIYIYI